MNTKELETVKRLEKLSIDIREENRMFRNDITEIIQQINTKVDSKHLPVTLEQDILQTTQQAIGSAISSVLGGYNSPLQKLVTSVVDENSTFLRSVISDSFNEVIRKDEFKQSIVSAFSHKVARTIISNNTGLFEKVSNELKQDAVFKAKLSLAVSNVVDEVLNSRKSV